MKLRSGRYKWLTRPMSINEIIPNEILEMILLKLPTKDLLQCRSVSKLWKSFASYICRRRYVAANLRDVFRSDSKTEAFYATFQDTSDLPWSACTLKVLKVQNSRGFLPVMGWFPVNRKQLKRFTDTFGPNICKLQLNGDHLYLIIPALMELPNLEILISGIDPPAKDMRRACSGNPLELNKLKQLQINVRSAADIQLVEFICSNAGNLNSILVAFGLYYPGVNKNFVRLAQNDLRQLTATLSRVPSIALGLWNILTMEQIQTLTVPQLKVKEFIFEFPLKDVSGQYYRVLEKFLAVNSNCLEKLEIRNFMGSRTAGPLQIPFLPKLKELDLKLRHVSSASCHVQPFTHNQFQSLKKITVLILEKNDGVHGIFGSAQFHSVQELILRSCWNNNSNPMSTDWSWMFPNLVTLDLDRVIVESYPYIYQNMPQLEHLSLKVHVLSARVTYDGSRCGIAFRGDANSVLSQYPKVTNKKNRGTVAQTQSLVSLTNLKTLVLDFVGCEIPDSTVHLALLKLCPLDSLTIRNIEISSEVKEKLSEYHGNVEVQPDFGDR